MAKPHKGAGIGAAASFIFGAGLNFSPIESGPLSAALMLIGAVLGAYAIKPHFWPWWKSLHWHAPIVREIGAAQVVSAKSTVTAGMGAVTSPPEPDRRAKVREWWDACGKEASESLRKLYDTVSDIRLLEPQFGRPLGKLFQVACSKAYADPMRNVIEAMSAYTMSSRRELDLGLLRRWVDAYVLSLKFVTDAGPHIKGIKPDQHGVLTEWEENHEILRKNSRQYFAGDGYKEVGDHVLRGGPHRRFSAKGFRAMNKEPVLPDAWEDEEDDPKKPGPKPERLKVDESFEQVARRILDAGKPPKTEDEEDEE